MNNVYTIIIATVLFISTSSLFFKYSPVYKATKNNKTEIGKELNIQNKIKSINKHEEKQNDNTISLTFFENDSIIKQCMENSKEKEIADIKENLKNRYIESGNEGYDSIPWGAKVEEVRSLYPDIKVYNSNEQDVEIILLQNGHQSYYFFDNKLYKGITHYYFPDERTTQSIINKMTQLYGKATDFREYSQGIEREYNYILGSFIYKNKVGLLIWWNKSSRFRITFDYYEEYSSLFESDLKYGKIEPDTSIEITYLNPKTIKEMEQLRDEQKNAEIKKTIDDLKL